MGAREAPRSTSLGDALTRGGRSLRGWLTAGALVALALLAVLALGLVWRQYEDAKQEATEEVRSRAILAATVFDTYFAGQLATLSAIAASPSVRSGDVGSMTRYFARFRPGGAGTFDAGVGWIDLTGHQRATSDPRGPTQLSLDDRTYFSSVVETRKPFVSEVIVGRTTQNRVVVMSVPTRDERGRLSGVLAGGLVLQPSSDDSRATELGYEGLQVIDRKGQLITRRDLARPENGELVSQLRSDREGVKVDTRGLDGSDDHVVAFASSEAPRWTVVLDQPESAVFGSARRDLLVGAALVAGAVALILALILLARRRARVDLRRQRARVSRWAELSRTLNTATSVDALRESVARSLAAEFPEATAIVAIGEQADNGNGATLVRGTHSTVDVDTETAASIARAVAEAQAPASLTDAEVRALGVSLGRALDDVRSLFGFPLADRTGMHGAAVLVFGSEHALDGTDLALLEAHAEQAAQALARVRRHQQEHDVAVLLQESLLPDDLPRVDGVRLAAHYRSGEVGTNAGGDWYDVVRRADGITHFSVGDVAGRGIRAAVSMGQLRHAFRAYALEHTSPAAIVQRVARHVDPDGMATMVCVTFDPLTYELAYASAGHVPPLLVDSDARTVRRLDGAASAPPLGWFGENATAEEATAVDAATSLALYSDGLVERRGVSLDDTIDRLGAAILEASDPSPERTLRTVIGEIAGAQLGDDVAVLLLRFEDTPSAVRIEIPAEPTLLRDLRRRVRGWLTLHGIEEETREAVVLALSEACNNAIEHAYRFGPGTIGIRLSHTDGALEVRVADTGEWREPLADTTRGRGLLIMRSLMDEADVVGGLGGTEVVLGQRF